MTTPPHSQPGSASRAEIEQAILRVLRELLGRERLGLHDNFFELGADSALVAEARMRLGQALGRDLDAVDLFTYPNIGALAAFLSGEDESSRAQAGTDRAQKRQEMMARRRSPSR